MAEQTSQTPTAPASEPPVDLNAVVNEFNEQTQDYDPQGPAEGHEAPRPEGAAETPTEPAEAPERSELQKEAIDQYRLPESVVDKFEDENDLSSYLAEIDRQSLGSQQQEQFPQMPGYGYQQPQQPGQPQDYGQYPQPGQPAHTSQPNYGQYPPQQQQQPQQNGYGPPPLDLPEDIDPGIKAAFEQQQKYFQENTQQLQQRLEAFVYQQQQDEANEFAAWFETQVDGLGDDYSVLGKGRVNPGSKEASERDNLFYTMTQISYATPHVSRDELFKRAVRLAYGNVQQQQRDRDLSQKLSGRAANAISRPTRREPGSMDQGDVTTDGLFQTDVDDIKAAYDRMSQER